MNDFHAEAASTMISLDRTNLETAWAEVPIVYICHRKVRLVATRPAPWVYFLFGVAFRYEASKYSTNFLGTFYFNVDRSYCLQPEIALHTKIIVTHKICLSMP